MINFGWLPPIPNSLCLCLHLIFPFFCKVWEEVDGSNFLCLATKSPSARYATVGLLVMASSGADQPGGSSVGGSGSEPSRADCIISNCCCCCFENCELVGWSPPAEQRELASHLECCCAQEDIGSHRGLCRMLRLEKRKIIELQSEKNVPGANRPTFSASGNKKSVRQPLQTSLNDVFVRRNYTFHLIKSSSTKF